MMDRKLSASVADPLPNDTRFYSNLPNLYSQLITRVFKDVAEPGAAQADMHTDSPSRESWVHGYTSKCLNWGR